MWCTRRLLIAWTVLLLIAPSFGETPTRPPTSNGVSDTPVAVCFAPGTPREVMARVHAAIFPPEFNGSRYFTGGSWSGIGEPTIITWSLVPDGLFISGDVGEPGSPSALFARMDSLFGNRSLWINLIQFSLERWAQLTGVQYVRVTAPGVDWDDGAPWGSSGSAARGDVRIAMHNIDGDAGILAYNFFPQNGDMVLDEGESWQDSLESFRFLRNVIMHEHGHGLGLGHVCTGISAQLMNPFLNLSFDGPQHDDIRGGQRQHGDPFEPDNTVTEATDLGVVEHGAPLDVGAVPAPDVTFGSILSIDQDGEEDWFRFTIEEPRVIEVIVAPVGRVYDNSPQNFDGNCSSGNLIDSAAIADLGFELLGGDGSTVIATADDRNAGETESVNDLILNDAGDYYIRVFESDSPSGTQLYSLEVRAEVTIPPKVAMSPHDIPKNRYVSFAPDNFGLSAFQVELTASVEFPSSTGVLGWVSEPDTNGLSRIVDAPYFSDTWPAVVHVGDCAIVPAATYELRASPDGVLFSEPLVLATVRKPGERFYGDVVGVGIGALPPDPGFSLPNGVVNVTDVQAFVLTAQGDSTPSAHITWVDLHGLEAGAAPNYILNVGDLQRIKFGFEGQRYADAPDHMNPADCP